MSCGCKFGAVVVRVLGSKYNTGFQQQLRRNSQQQIKYARNSRNVKNSSAHHYQQFTNPTRHVVRAHFHTSPRHNVPNPVFLVLIKKFAKLGVVVGGRAVRRFIPKLKEPHKGHYKLRVFLGCLFVGGCLWIIISYNIHKKDAPMTGRTRYIAFSNEQFKELIKYELENVLAENKDRIVKPNSKDYAHLAAVINRIIAANQDIEFFQKQNWTLTLIDVDAMNAMVQPTGDIIVFKGLLKLAENDDQLATVLAHELSHVYLSHGAEKVSVMGLIENIVIIVTLAIWALMPGDISASIMHWLYGRFISVLLHLPYSRMLEDEADEVGLELMAKACYDVREASNFWMRMETASIVTDEAQLPEFLSTHPHNLNRSSRLDDLTYRALKTRTACKCYELPKEDPRERGQKIYQMAVQQQEELRRQEEAELVKSK